MARSSWTTLHERSEQWLSGVALAAVRLEIARLSVSVGLAIPETLKTTARAIGATATRSVASERPHEATLSQAHETQDDLTDGVTGLLKESGFNERLAALTRQPTGPAWSLLLIGVDNIERINNRYGRSGGDDALHTVAYLLRNYRLAPGRRGERHIYKLNGPQFAYLLGDTPLADAARIAEEIRQSIAESAMFLEQITVSIGVVANDEIEQGQETPAVLLVQTAQNRLHIARTSGMNTVCTVDPEGVSSLGAGASILIADPDAPYLEVLTRQLTEQGYAVLVAEDGEDALDIIDQIVPDVIVCEVMLPKTNGFAVRERLRHSARLSEIPFVLISHRKNDEMIEKASLLGIVHFLRKPLSLVELTGLLRNLSGAPTT
ncbi:MAG: response regulator [Spirochaetota bacterium]